MASSDETRTPRVGKGGAKRKRARGGKGGGAANLGLLRHQARVLALQVLYEVELTGHEPRQALRHILDGETVASDDEGDDARAAVPPVVQGYVEKLVHGVMLYLYKLDPLLETFAPAFNRDQTPPVDRTVLRMGAYELLYEGDVPPKVAINEAVELAKRFGGERSGGFVNGVLGRVLEHRRQSAAAAAEKPQDPPTAEEASRPR